MNAKLKAQITAGILVGKQFYVTCVDVLMLYDIILLAHRKSTKAIMHS